MMQRENVQKHRLTNIEEQNLKFSVREERQGNSPHSTALKEPKVSVLPQYSGIYP